MAVKSLSICDEVRDWMSSFSLDRPERVNDESITTEVLSSISDEPKVVTVSSHEVIATAVARHADIRMYSSFIWLMMEWGKMLSFRLFEQRAVEVFVIFRKLLTVGIEVQEWFSALERIVNQFLGD